MTRNVLVVEDQRELAHLVAKEIGNRLACKVKIAPDGPTGLTLAQSGRFDLILLDVMLPGIDGLEICKKLRTNAVQTPIMMLTAHSSDLDRVLGLELGADDYLVKPFNMAELVARVRALFRRIDMTCAPARPGSADQIEAGALSLDVTRRQAYLHGAPVALTAREFDILLHFAKNPGRVYTRAQLLDVVWGYGHEGYEHAVNCTINRLRAKIEPDPSRPIYVKTVRGFGYKLAEPDGIAP